MSDDLDVIDGGPVASVTIKGTAYEFGALEVGTLPAFARAIRPMANEVVAFVTAGPSVDGALGLLADHGENLITAVSLASGVPLEVLNKTKPHEALPLIVKVFEVNRDFFVLHLLPAMREALQRVRPATSGAGQTP